MKIIPTKINNDLAQINKIQNWNIDQPDPVSQLDVFEPHTRIEQTQQTRQNSALINHNFQSQNTIN